MSKGGASNHDDPRWDFFIAHSRKTTPQALELHAVLVPRARAFLDKRSIDLGEAEANGAKVFHAGTKLEGGQLVSSGGRVLNVTASGSSATEAQAAAYAAVDAIDFPDGFCRRDIGQREVRRERG